MLRRLLAFTLLFPLFKGQLYSQSYNSQRTQVLLVNVISNAIMGGIGGAINKGKDEKVYKAFIRNFLKGSVGGLVKYSAKYQAYSLGTEQLSFYAPFNRLYFFLGHSMVMNAAFNRKLLDTYYCNFYGVDLRFNLKEEQKIKARLSLVTAGSFAFFALSRNYQLDVFRSLEYGQFFFGVHNNDPYSGKAVFNCIAIAATGNRISAFTIPHEIIHTYQQYDMFSISSFYHKKEESLVKNNKLLNKLSNYLVTDYQAGFFTLLYLTQPQPWHFKNYFEFEAEHFKIRSYIPR